MESRSGRRRAAIRQRLPAHKTTATKKEGTCGREGSDSNAWTNPANTRCLKEFCVNLFRPFNIHRHLALAA